MKKILCKFVALCMAAVLAASTIAFADGTNSSSGTINYGGATYGYTGTTRISNVNKTLTVSTVSGSYSINATVSGAYKYVSTSSGSVTTGTLVSGPKSMSATATKTISGAVYSTCTTTHTVIYGTVSSTRRTFQTKL